jgi:hypothetical protein
MSRSKKPHGFYHSYFDIGQGKAAGSCIIVFYTTIAIVLAAAIVG